MSGLCACADVGPARSRGPGRDPIPDPAPVLELGPRVRGRQAWVNARGPPLLQKAYEISNLPKDFKISVEISRISGILAGFQGFQLRFKDFNDRFEDFYAFPGELLHPKTAQGPGDGPCHLTIDRTVCARERTGSYMY